MTANSLTTLQRDLSVQERLRGPGQKPDPAILGPIDEKIARELPGWSLEEGCAYWRWAVRMDQTYDDAMLALLIQQYGAEGGYSGLVMGKPMTVLFFYPRF